MRKGQSPRSFPEFGARMRQRREQLHLTQAELARRIGVARQQVNDWERNARTPSLATARAVAVWLDTSLDYLAGLTNIPHAVIVG